ncbi:transposable element Tcb1 transposase [Trichonephila clavipes]|nr:transposable element Tcb1 transposase [Trichonephila clavipes]
MITVYGCGGALVSGTIPLHTVLRHTARTAGVMVWRVIAYDSRSTLIGMQGTLTGQRYVDDILLPRVGHFLNGPPGAIFQQDNARPHTERVAQNFLRQFQTLPWPARSPDLFPVEHVQAEWQIELHTCDIYGYSAYCPNDKHIRIWRKHGTRNQPQNITEHHAFRDGSIMVWPGISLGYRTNLHIFKQGSVTAVRYRDEVLEPIVRLYAAAVGPTFLLMDDNTRPHRADIVDDYLESEGIACMAWPAYSPDLNPIENLWDALGCAVSSRFPHPATFIELETALQEEWRLLLLRWLTT